MFPHGLNATQWATYIDESSIILILIINLPVKYSKYSATWYPEYIAKSPKIFAPQKVPKIFAWSFLSLDK